MEKLIKLLNEHRAELLNWNIQNKPMRYSYGGYVFWLADLTVQNCILLIISKSYGFIKRLVDNDKIDLDKLPCVFAGNINKWKTLLTATNWDEMYEWTEYDAYESLLMLLTIQDEPIEFLCSILK